MQQVEEITGYADRIRKDAESGDLFGIIAFERRKDGRYEMAERGNFSLEDGQAVLLLLQAAISGLMGTPVPDHKG